MVNMDSVVELTNLINSNKEIVVANIGNDSVDVYDYIQKQFNNGDVASNTAFQKAYNSFYRLNSAGLTKIFKSNYFRLLQEKRSMNVFNRVKIKDILLELYKYKNTRGLNCIHFSFTTKLIHTIDNGFPIYDSNIKKVFGLKGPYNYYDTIERINIYLKQHKTIDSIYSQIIEENLLENTIQLFELKFSNYSLSKIKILDFIFWTAGKLNLF